MPNYVFLMNDQRLWWHDRERLALYWWRSVFSWHFWQISKKWVLLIYCSFLHIQIQSNVAKIASEVANAWAYSLGLRFYSWIWALDPQRDGGAILFLLLGLSETIMGDPHCYMCQRVLASFLLPLWRPSKESRVSCLVYTTLLLCHSVRQEVPCSCIT